MVTFLIGYVVGSIVGAAVVTWCGMNLLAWDITRTEYRREFDAPFNWRALIGSGPYFKWLERQEGE
jgi:hypothetical protein